MDRSQQPQAQPTPSAEPWPEGVIARYLTVAGAHVNLTHRLNALTPPEPFATLAACTGCPASSEHNHHRLVWGMHSQYEKHLPELADSDARDWAQAHAEKCRALPRPAETA